MGISELDRIGAEGAALDLAGPAPGPSLDAPPAAPPSGPTEADQVAMWAAIPATFGSILAMAMPELAAVYSPGACESWGRAMLPVAKKHGWNDLDSLPEISLCLVSLPFAIGTFVAVKARRTPGASVTEGKGGPGAKVVPISTQGPNAGVV
jgi:hypothetical protein